MKKQIIFLLLFACSVLKGQTAFPHTTNSSNINNGYMTTIEHPNWIGLSSDIIIITLNRVPSRNDDYTKNYGVWYDQSVQKWKIFTEDGITMSTGLTFNVLVMPIGQNAFTIKADTLSIRNHGFNHGTLFNNPATNNNKDAILLVTHNGGTGNKPILNNNSLIVDYSEAHNQWGIAHNGYMAYFVGLTNSVNSLMKPNVFDSHTSYSYNVVYFEANSPYTFIHTVETCKSTQSNNQFFFTTFLNNPKASGSNKLIFATPNWGISGRYNESPICVQYGTPQDGFIKEGCWSIINANTNALPQGLKFNVAVFYSK